MASRPYSPSCAHGSPQHAERIAQPQQPTDRWEFRRRPAALVSHTGITTLPAPRLAAHRVRRRELSGLGEVLLRLLWSAGQLKGLPKHVERIRIERIGIDQAPQEGLGGTEGRRAVARQGQQAQYGALIRQLKSSLLEQWHGSWSISILEQALSGAVQVIGVHFHAAHGTNDMRRR